jgi:hypothetical protein
MKGTERTIYVFDFDCTITISHTGGVARIPMEISPGFIRNNVKSAFREVVEHLADRGEGIYIASFGDDHFALGNEESVAGYDLIRCYLDEVLGHDQSCFTYPERNGAGEVLRHGNVIAKDSRDFKEYHLKAIAGIENLDIDDPMSLRRIVFIDDEAGNVRFASGKGCTILVPSSYRTSASIARSGMLFRKMAEGLGIRIRR